ncbi:MAG TPA: tripartite tricarboxylate transporter substrate binding protein [Casimicrobiaceae bacterium]|nr:tripartite tricarboxylate transporter substrate binding protein [Casimicrobiaceae bacterium]
MLSMVLLAAWSPLRAQEFPTKPIRIIVPYAAGGVVDALARVLAAPMHEAMGQPVIVENKPGASGIVGMQACANAAPDGYTFCITVQDSLSYNPYLFASLPYDAEKDFAPITNLGWTNGLIVANAKSGIGSYQELVSAAKARPGKLNWGTWGEASQPDILLRAINSHEHLAITAIPYKGAGQANPALFSGEIDLTYMGIGNAMQHIQAGTLKPIVLTGKQHVAALPGVPTLAEVGADPGLPGYMAAFAPARTPKAILDRLQGEIAKAAQNPAVQQFYRNYTLTFVGNTPAEFAQFVKSDRATAARVFQKMGFKRGGMES